MSTLKADWDDSVLQIHLQRDIEELLKNTTIPFVKYSGTIVSVEKWIQPKISHLSYEFYHPHHGEYHYSEQRCLYRVNHNYAGPRLDVDIELKIYEEETKKITINIYNEIMEITGYTKMSPKLSESIMKNEGRTIDVYVFENGEIALNVKSLMSLNYGYTH